MDKRIESLEQKELTAVEREMLQIIKTLNFERVHDTSSVLFELKTDVTYFWLRFKKLEEEINKINKKVLKVKK
ncbi:hypothetical protein RJD24_08925 [Bacillaceae bacterium IKA-2]|nr:hypothetical protein RJD24_08925 [Bacillaceae bacterium IKA-2]